MAESKTVSIAVAATVTSILVASVLFSTTKRKRKDITKSILIKSAPVAAAEELAASGSSTCERLLDGRQLVISSNARVADYIFNGRSKDNYVRRPAVDDGLQALGMFQSGLIWNNDLPVWKKIRSCFRKSLNDATLHRAVTVAEEECQVLLQESIHASSETALALNLLSLSRKVTFRVTLNVFFGIPSSAFASLKIHEDAFIESIVAYFKAWEYFLLRPVGKWDSATAEDHEQAVANLNVHVEKLLDAVATYMPEHTKSDEPQSHTDDLFVGRLRVACMSEKGHSNVLFAQSALEMMLAGTDTSSVTAYYALLGLAGDPSLQQELRQEVSNSNKTGLLNGVMNETLRFKPVGPVVLREPTATFPVCQSRKARQSSFTLQK